MLTNSAHPGLHQGMVQPQAECTAGVGSALHNLQPATYTQACSSSCDPAAATGSTKCNTEVQLSVPTASMQMSVPTASMQMSVPTASLQRVRYSHQQPLQIGLQVCANQQVLHQHSKCESCASSMPVTQFHSWHCSHNKVCCTASTAADIRMGGTLAVAYRPGDQHTYAHRQVSYQSGTMPDNTCQ